MLINNTPMALLQYSTSIECSTSSAIQYLYRLEEDETQNHSNDTFSIHPPTSVLSLQQQLMNKVGLSCCHTIFQLCLHYILQYLLSQ